MIGGVELLEFDWKSKLLELLNKLFVDNYEKGKMKWCLIILYTRKDSDISNSLDLLKNWEILKIFQSNVEIISSDESGVGKSTKIKLEIKKA